MVRNLLHFTKGRFGRGRAPQLFDEVSFIYTFLINDFNPVDLNIVDVGAAYGSVSDKFIKVGASATLIEPHPRRIDFLLDKFSQNPRVRILPFAVSDEARSSVHLYDSEESWGISSITKWHHSHYPAHKVETKPLRDLELPAEIHLLKIDTEGHDLEVLQSLNWKEHNVHMIMAEYDDNKVGPEKQGSWQPIKDYMMSLGFSCMVSEWYPIERYGIAHKWRKLHKDSSSSPKIGSWGNVLGFRSAPSQKEVDSAFAVSLKGPGK